MPAFAGVGHEIFLMKCVLCGALSCVASSRNSTLPHFLSRPEVRGVVITFVAYFFGTGILMPYFPIWLHDRGLSASQIALALGLPLFARIIATPLFALVASRLGAHVLGSSLAAIALIGVLLMQFYPPYWVIVVITALTYASWQSVALHFDPEAMNLVRRKLVPTYGVIRAFGSSAYIAATVSGGIIVGAFGSTAAMYYFVAVATVLIFFSSRLRSLGRPQPKAGEPRAKATWRRPSLVMVTIAAALVMGTHSSFTSFGGLHMRALGYSDSLIGIILATMTAAELLMFAFGSRFVTGVPPVALIAVGAMAATLRWTAVAFVDSPALLMGLQLLQSLTFAGTYLGFAGYVVRHVAAEQSVSAQGMYMASFVAINGCVTLAVGSFYDRIGAQSFLISATLPLLALGLLAARRFFLPPDQPLVAAGKD